MNKRFNFYVERKHNEDWLDTEGPFEDFAEAYNCACDDWSHLADIEKKSYLIQIYKEATLYDDDNEPVESEIVVEAENEQFSVGQGYFMLDGKKYHKCDIEEYFNENDCNIKDMASIDYTSYRLGIDHFEKYVYTIYKAVGKDGRDYEVAITHDLIDGIMCSDLDAYTSEMNQEVQLAK